MVFCFERLRPWCWLRCASKFTCARADVYSFGIIMWEILTQRELYEGIHPLSLAYRVMSQGARPELDGSIEAVRAQGVRRPADLDA